MTDSLPPLPIAPSADPGGLGPSSLFGGSHEHLCPIASRKAGLEFPAVPRADTAHFSPTTSWYVRGIYGAKGASEAEWGAVRDRAARTLTRECGPQGLRRNRLLYRAIV